MKEEIIDNIQNPRRLEALYRENKMAFRSAFNVIYQEIKENATAQIWNERLNFERNDISWGTNTELVVVIIASFLAGLIAKIPDFTAIDPEFFYPRNIAFIVFPLLAAYFIWKQKVEFKKIVVISITFLIAAIYINLLPDNRKSDTLVLACMHLALFLWTVLGYAYVGGKLHNYQKRLDFLRYNGDLIVMTAIFLLAGGLMAAITVGLFSLIDVKIEELYFQYVGIWGLSAAPILGTYLVQTNPQLVGKVAPIIAKVFTPLALVTLVVYLIAVIYTGKDPYNDRDFLIIFNLLLVGVMALILFSIIETSKNAGSKIETLLLLGLAVMTIVINGIALSAIVFRISEWGITPNRLAVLGSNLLMLTNLLMVTYRLFRSVNNPREVEKVEKSIALFLPVYSIWTILVTFVFPILFSFK
ncbi:hypothetical protein FEM33_25125 [Dyadobacter flavalbus]|uniref:DUF4153 domain-containing protein n=1 Tax=Dyadobacter flavalbus TaxID=2579942 RepID=A0A5M8Q9R4_9BACT|nr:hypothetical protein [Dyadobacter flavalbus]KAA6431590.1 hypothetical protein FEM33_25125 [Dyadobacter flavalbus]